MHENEAEQACDQHSDADAGEHRSIEHRFAKGRDLLHAPRGYVDERPGARDPRLLFSEASMTESSAHKPWLQLKGQ